MLEKKELMNNLTKEVKILEQKVNNRKIYNLKIHTKRFFIRSGIVLDRTIPFITASIISFGVLNNVNKNPFVHDRINEYANECEVNTSNGFEKEFISYDEKYNENKLEYSTSWQLNDCNLYERTITTYNYEDVSKYELDELLAFSKDQLDELLSIESIHYISKDKLDMEDEFYTENMVISTTSGKSTKEYLNRYQTIYENIIDILSYLCLIGLMSGGIMVIEHIAKYPLLRDYLKKILAKQKIINKKDEKELRKILKLKKENLDLLLPSDQN